MNGQRAVAAAAVLVLACGGLEGSWYLPDQPGWASQLDCQTRLGVFHFQRAPASGCAVLEEQYLPLADEIWQPVAPAGAVDFGPMQIWVFNLDTTAEEPFDRMDMRKGAESITWMDRCLNGLAHEELHYYEVRVLGTAPWISNWHRRWESDEAWALADRRWYGQTKAICGVLHP